MIVIRPESVADESTIREVTRRAFAGQPYSAGNEPDIVDALRMKNALTLSLVAEDDGGVVGHVAFSPARSEDGTPGWYTLGPVSVMPEVQRRGIGQALINAGIARLRELDASGCIVLGDTNYYSRFGFSEAPQLAPPGVPEAHFMVLTLSSPAPTCILHFHPVFNQEG